VLTSSCVELAELRKRARCVASRSDLGENGLQAPRPGLTCVAEPAREHLAAVSVEPCLSQAIGSAARAIGGAPIITTGHRKVRFARLGPFRLTLERYAEPVPPVRPRRLELRGSAI
jgi:hypothetical protein